MNDSNAGIRARPWLRTCLALLLTLCFSTAMADAFDDDDFEEEPQKPLLEDRVVLPEFPKPENLLPFSGGPSDTQSYAIDTKSVSVGKFGTVFYSVVATSQSGARNISYEGIRCNTKEYKLHAFGHKDGTWTRARINKWREISTRSHITLHATLFKDYFCNIGSVAGTAEQIVDRIRHQRPIEGW